MCIQLRIVRTTEDKAKVYRLRRRVFVEEEKRFPLAADHIVDRYDSFSETVNFLALSDGEPAAAIRLTLDNPAGLPAQDAYDFSAFRRNLEGGCASIGWLCIRKAFRRHPGLVVSLIQMCFREMRKAGARHVLSVLHPPVLPLLKRLVGATAAGPKFVDHVLQVPMVPMHVDMEALPPGSRERFADPAVQPFDDAAERRLFRKNDIIVSKDAPGTEVFQVIRGVVHVHGGTDADARLTEESGPSTQPILFGPGQVFGELSVIDGGCRTATISAHSDEVDVMVWDRDSFLDQVHRSPERMLFLLGLMAGRLRYAIEEQGSDPSTALAARLLVDASRHGRQAVDTRWLARQCGLDRRSFDTLVMPWEANRWIAADPERTSIRVIDGARLATATGMP